MKKVQVLLSAYNGELYITEQIQSILRQSYPHISILVRDDGSSDRTVELLQPFIEAYPDRIQLIGGSNIGVVASFFELLRQSDPQADYFCFCDQDDVWLDHKIESAQRLLKTYSGKEPAMVFTATELTDNHLQKQGLWPKAPSKPPSFYNALIQNIAVGATITINKAARDLFLNFSSVDHHKVIMHDWWFYLIVSAFGHVVYDSDPSMLYRQHGNNVIGGSNSPLSKVQQKLRSYLKHKGKHFLHHQAEEFYKVYGQLLDGEKKDQLEMFLAPRKQLLRKLKFLRKSKLYRQSVLEQWLFRILIVFGYI
ncbi:glycosyltransferase family 2 protein [Paenibacillus dendritiformis]|uniref:glycosyltransferase family 2 protein n=1 Tax=Paenibacillus dendritiformis TaxID=130049 RepID=UPI00387E0C8F